uniref:Core-binding (CB) domain-containing protein n=1 Tax=Pygocentrus nattereri TaxID=42514 RepID=A0AAR2LN62_PYGNA
MLINAKISVFLFLSNRQPRSRNFLLCPICKKTHWSLPVHLRRSCMRTSSEADILAVVESAKRAVSNLLRTGRVWEYSLLSRIMQSPDTIGRMIEELESRGNAVVGIPTEAPTAAVPAVPDVPVEAPAESSSESSGELYQCPDTTKQGTSLRERMASLGYYKKHSLDHDLLVSFAKFLQFDMSNENFKQEVENVARFLYFMDPQQASLLFVRQHEKSREYFLKLSEAGLSKQTVQNYIKSVKRFLKFHTGSTDLCFTDRVLHEDCKNYISFLDNIQMATSKQVSKETTRKRSVSLLNIKIMNWTHNVILTINVLIIGYNNASLYLHRFDTFQEGVLSSTQVTAVLAAAKKDFLAVIGKLHAGECSPGHQLTLTELQLVLYYLEAIVILEHAQRPGVVEHMTVTEWISRRRDDTRPGFVVVSTQVATFVLTQEQEMWFDLYFSEVRPVMLGKKRKRVEDDDETDERFFISSTGKAIYNASNDLERLHKK